MYLLPWLRAYAHMCVHSVLYWHNSIVFISKAPVLHSDGTKILFYPKESLDLVICVGKDEPKLFWSKEKCNPSISANYNVYVYITIERVGIPL